MFVEHSFWILQSQDQNPLSFIYLSSSLSHPMSNQEEKAKKTVLFCFMEKYSLNGGMKSMDNLGIYFSSLDKAKDYFRKRNWKAATNNSEGYVLRQLKIDPEDNSYGPKELWYDISLEETNK